MFKTDWNSYAAALSEPLYPADLLWMGLLLLLILVLAGVFLWQESKARQRKALKELRHQIARDFHDEMGSKLSVIGMYSELIRHRLGEPEAEVGRYLNKILYTSTGLYSSMKDLIWSLDPDGDVLSSLVQKLELAGQELFEEQGVDFSIQMEMASLAELKLPVAQKRHLLLTVKEAMNNAHKYAECTTFSIGFRRKAEMLEVTVQDNGKGFNPEKINRGEGLDNMQARMDQVGGTFAMSSGQEGTRVELRVPVGGL